MREIKFRAYDAVLGMRPVVRIDWEKRLLWVRATDGQFYELSFDNSPPLEWSGLGSQNGQETYEGDIIDLGEHNIAEIVFKEGAFLLRLPHGYFRLRSWEGKIIGNIDENPELCASPTSSTSAPPA